MTLTSHETKIHMDGRDRRHKYAPWRSTFPGTKRKNNNKINRIIFVYIVSIFPATEHHLSYLSVCIGKNSSKNESFADSFILICSTCLSSAFNFVEKLVDYFQFDEKRKRTNGPVVTAKLWQQKCWDHCV